MASSSFEISAASVYISGLRRAGKGADLLLSCFPTLAVLSDGSSGEPREVHANARRR